MNGIAGKCNRECKIGRAHELDCRNYIEVDLPCPVCEELYGRHIEECLLSRTPHPSQEHPNDR